MLINKNKKKKLKLKSLQREMKGINCSFRLLFEHTVQVPTTLVGMVHASIFPLVAHINTLPVFLFRSCGFRSFFEHLVRHYSILYLYDTASNVSFPLSRKLLIQTSHHGLDAIQMLKMDEKKTNNQNVRDKIPTGILVLKIRSLSYFSTCEIF